jgi:hypothetical protein
MQGLPFQPVKKKQWADISIKKARYNVAGHTKNYALLQQDTGGHCAVFGQFFFSVHCCEHAFFAFAFFFPFSACTVAVEITRRANVPIIIFFMYLFLIVEVNFVCV